MVNLDALTAARKSAVTARKDLENAAKSLERAREGSPWRTEYEELTWVDLDVLDAAYEALGDAFQFVKEGIALIDDVFDDANAE